MKKYLMTVIAAVTMCAAFTSCSHDSISQYTEQEIALNKYEATFVSRFGQPASNQTWGFGTINKARTRAADEFGWELSEGYDMEFDKSYFDACLELLPEGVNAENKLTNYEFLSTGPFQFSIIYSKTSAADKVGYYYYDPAQGVSSRQEVQFVDNIQNMSQYLQWSYANTYDGVDYWTVDDAGITGQNVGDVWGWDRGASKSKMNAKVFTVNIPAGYRVGFYVINNDDKMYSNQSLNEDGLFYSALANKGDVYLVGLEDWNNKYANADFDCNDVIMSVSKSTNPPTIVEDPKDEPTADVRIIAEDLTVDESGDFDFNDVVFDVTFNKPEGKTTITLQAAGGTLPLYVGGVEVHEKFGVGVKDMVNTGAGPSKSPVSFELDGLYGNNAINIPITVTKTDANGDEYTLTLEANQGRAPHKIAVKPTFKWCPERADIEKTYTNFSEWVKDPSVSWY